jgi:DNA-directed RNA polymerase omega subunit
MTDMDETYDRDDSAEPLSEHGESDAPAEPSEPAPPIQSRFLFVDVAALRAKQLRRGARVRFENTHVHKPERVAMEEVRRGLVYYEVPSRLPDRSEERA